MIIDKIENAKFYYGLGERIKKGLEYIRNANLESMENGKYEISKDEIFISVQDYYTKPESEGKFEAHKKYIDIQYIISGEEKLGYTNISNCTKLTDYNESDDIEFLEGKGSFLNASKGMFLIFTPEDAHMPCISINEKTYVKKAVVKAAV